MAIPVVESSAKYVSAASPSSFSATPSGVTVGDFLVSFCAIRAGGRTVTVPPGFTLHDSFQSNNGWHYTLIAYKVATGSDSFTWSWTGGGSACSGVSFRISGVDTSSPIDDSSARKLNTSSVLRLNAVTTTVADCLLVGCLGIRAGCNPGDPAGWTLHEDADPGTGSQGDSWSKGWSLDASTAGTYGTYTITESSDQRGAGAYVLALAPAGGSSGYQGPLVNGGLVNRGSTYNINGGLVRWQ